MTKNEALAHALALISETYRGRWVPGPATMEVWSDLLDGMTAEEIVASSRGWCQAEKWPPTPSDLRNGVSRLCVCGTCSACKRRAWRRSYAAAQAAVTAGAIGYFPESRDVDRLEAPRGGQRLLE